MACLVEFIVWQRGAHMLINLRSDEHCCPYVCLCILKFQYTIMHATLLAERHLYISYWDAYHWIYGHHCILSIWCTPLQLAAISCQFNAHYPTFWPGADACPPTILVLVCPRRTASSTYPPPAALERPYTDEAFRCIIVSHSLLASIPYVCFYEDAFRFPTSQFMQWLVHSTPIPCIC